MNPEVNKAVVQAYIEMWNTGNAVLAATVLAPTYVDHAHLEITGLPRFVQTLERVRSTLVPNPYLLKPPENETAEKVL